MKKEMVSFLPRKRIEPVLYFNLMPERQLQNYIKEKLGIHLFPKSKRELKIIEQSIKMISEFVRRNDFNNILFERYIVYCRSKKFHFNNWITQGTLNAFYQIYRNSQDLETGIHFTRSYIEKNMKKEEKISVQMIMNQGRIVHDIKTCRFSFWFIIMFEPETRFLENIRKDTLHDLLNIIDVNIWNKKTFSKKEEARRLKEITEDWIKSQGFRL